MKKPQFKLLKEFKAFISKGNALDLAVGMIIGSAFTAIITALVNGILKPIINCIIALCMGDKGLENAVTFLSKAYVDGSDVIDMANSIYIDWGTLISAIITFLLTAIVLFAIIKAINAAKDVSKQSAKKLKKQLKRGEITAEEAASAQQAAEVEVAKEEPVVDPTLELLKEIRDLLKAQKVDEATAKLEGVDAVEAVEQ